MKVVWHWWENGKRVTRYRALGPPGIFKFKLLDVRTDHKGRMLYDVEMLYTIKIYDARDA